LVKPDGTDLVDIAVINSNYDKIDANIASTKIQATKPSTANAGDLWWDSNTGTLYLYYTDANSSQWVAATSDPVNIGVVANQSDRDAQYPTPGQGMRVWRTDLGAEEAYYGLYNVSTNPGGRTPAGWYQEPVGRTLQMVSQSFNVQFVSTTGAFVDTGFSLSITPKSATSKLVITYAYTFTCSGSGQVLGGQVAITDSANTILTKNRFIYYEDGTGVNRAHDSGSSLVAVVDAVNTNSRTYKIRLQSDTSGQVGIRGNEGGPYWPFMTITEIAN
jgi:hypothetical protein